MTDHELKSWSLYFRAMVIGYKTFDYRKNDRGFKQGDTLYLREWNERKEQYTGRRARFIISHVWYTIPGMPKEYCILEVRLLQYWNVADEEEI